MKAVFKQFSKKTLSMIIAFMVVICSFGTTLSTFMDLGAKAVGVEHFEVTYGSPAVPMFEKTTINLYDLRVQFTKDGDFVDGTDVTWSAEAGTPAEEYLNPTSKTFTALGTGIFKVTATETANTANTKTIYIIVNKQDDFEFYLVNENLKSATLPADTWYYGKNTFGGAWGNNWTNGAIQSVVTASNAANGYSMSNGWSSANSGFFYKSDILNDFADYTVLFGARHTSENIRGSFLNVVLRADLADDIAVGKNALAAGSTALSLGIRPLGGLSLYGYGASSNPDKALTLHTVEDSSLIKPQSSDVKYLFGNLAAQGASANGSNIRDISIKLEGNDILYTLDGRTILDTTQDIKTLTADVGGGALGTTAASYSTEGTMTDTTYENYMNGYNLGKGTVGFTWLRSAYCLTYLKVKINNIESAEQMPVAAVVSLETISTDAAMVSTTTNAVLDLSNYIYAFESGAHIGTAVDFVTSDYNASVNESYLTVSGRTVTATKAGVYAVEATYGSEKLTVFVKVTNTANADVYTVNNSSPAVPMFEKTAFDLSNVIVEFENGNYYYGNDIVWSVDESNTTNLGFVLSDSEKTMGVLKSGMYILKATVTTDSGTYSRRVYFVVNEKGNYEFILANEKGLNATTTFDSSKWLYTLAETVSPTSEGIYYNSSALSALDIKNIYGSDTRLFIYRSNVLRDFADYTVSTSMKIGGENGTKAFRGIIARLQINPDMFNADGTVKAEAVGTFAGGGNLQTAPSIGVVKPGTSAMLLSSYNFSGLSIRGYYAKSGTEAVPFANDEKEIKYDTLADNSIIKIVNRNPNYVLSTYSDSGITAVTNYRDVVYTLDGDDIVYSIDGNVILDTKNNNTVNVMNASCGYDDVLGEGWNVEGKMPAGGNFDHPFSDLAAESKGEFNSYIDSFGTEKGTVGIIATTRTELAVESLKVTINGIDGEEDIPYAEEYDPETVSTEVTAVVDTELDLSKYMYEFETGMQTGGNVTFAFSDRNASVNEQYAAITGGTFKATKAGVYTVDAIYGTEAITFQIFVSAAADKELYKVSDRSPAVPMFVNTRLDIDELAIEFENGQYFYGRDITWTIDESNPNDSGIILNDEGKTLAPIEIGTFVLKATVTTDNGTLSRIVYFVVNNKGDYNFYLVNLDLTIAGENAYKAEEWVNATGDGANNYVVRSGGTQQSGGISPGYASAGFLVYNNPMLQNFADYTVEYDILGAGKNLSQAVSFIARAKLDSEVQAGDKIFTSTDAATGYNAFALQYPLYGGPAIQNFTTRFSSESLWETVGYSTATFDQVKYSETPSEYVFGGSGTVSIKLSGSDVVSSVDGVVLFDTSAETLNKYEFTVNYANCEKEWAENTDIIQSTGTVKGSELKQIIANQTNTGKGTVGISMIRADAHSRRLKALRIKLNDTTAANIPVAEDYNPYIVKSASPALPMTAGTKINLSDFMIQLGAFAYEADGLTFGAIAAVQNGAVADGVKVEGGAIKAYKRGVYSVTVTAKDGSNRSQKIYIVVKNADEDEYVIYDKDYRGNGVDVSDWTTTVTDDKGNVLTEGTNSEGNVTLNFSGNYAEKAGVNGFVPYDITVIKKGFSYATAGTYAPVNIYTTLNNEVVKSLADYTVTASFKASPGARGGIGVMGRINGTSGYGFGSGAKGAYNISGALPLNAPFAITGTSLSAIQDVAGVTNYFYNTVTFSNYTYRVYSVKYSGSTMSLSAPDGSTKTVTGISSAAGGAGFVTYNKDTISGYNAVPVLAEFKVSIKNVDLSNLPTSSISGYTADTTTKAPVYAADNNVKFTLNSDKAISLFALINNSKPYPEKIVIPSVVDGVKSTVINYRVFGATETDASKALVNTLGEVVISDGISTILDGAFRGQKNLDTVTLPNTLETIGESAFNATGIIDLVIPSNTLTIGKYAFSGVPSMHSLVIGGESDKTERLYKSKLTTITDLAFSGCSALTVVELPMNLKKIGNSAFSGCTSLDKLYVYSRNVVFGNTVVPTSTTIYGATGSTAEAYADANGNPFVAIDGEIAAVEQAYEDYLAAIEAAAQLKANTEDTGVVYEFYKKTSETTGGVAGLIPSNPNAGKFVLPLIGSYTSEITGQTFTDFDVTYVKANAFKDCEYKSSIYNVVIPEGYTEIQDSAFAGCTELRYISLPDTLNFIRNYSFTNNTWLKAIELPKNLATIGKGAFQGSGRLADVTFAEGAVCYSIGESAFQGTAIETIKLPVHLRHIGAKAFADTPLTDVYIYNREAAIGANAFPKDTVIHGIAGSTAHAYASANGYDFVPDITDTWDDVINKVDPNGKFTFGVDNNGRYSAASYSAGGKIVIPYEIDYKAADGTVTKGALVTKVGVNMFKNKTDRFQVTSLVVPEGVTVIEDSSFINCANLVSLTIPSTLQRVEQWAFSGADIHGELVFGINCNFIGQAAFANNTDIKAVYIYNPNCVIEDDAFVYSTNTSVNEKVTAEDRIKIYGVKDSTAQTYASKNGHEFIEIQAGQFPTISAVKDNGNYILTGDAATNTVVGYARKDANKPYSEKIVFPSKLNGADMNTIQGSLFKQKPYTSSIVAVVIEEGYTIIGDSAFSGCERLVRVQLPSTLTEINNSAFANTALAGELVIPESVTKIGGSAFAGCENLTSVTITNPTVTIGPNAFSEMAKGFTIRGLTGSTAEEYYQKYKKYGIKFEAIGEYIDPNAPTEEENDPNANKDPNGTKENEGDLEENKTTLFGVQVDDLTLIIIIGIGALMLLLLIAGVVIVIIVANSNDDDEDDEYEDDEYEDEEEYEDEDEYEEE